MENEVTLFFKPTGKRQIEIEGSETLTNKRVFVFDPFRRIVAIPIFHARKPGKAVQLINGREVLAPWAEAGYMSPDAIKREAYPWELCRQAMTKEQYLALTEYWYNSPSDPTGLRYEEFPDAYLPERIIKERELAKKGFQGKRAVFKASFDKGEKQDAQPARAKARGSKASS